MWLPAVFARLWRVPAFHPLPDGRPSWFSEPVKQFTNVSVSAEMRLTSNSTSQKPIKTASKSAKIDQKRAKRIKNARISCCPA
jgi:hypothetical protein